MTTKKEPKTYIITEEVFSRIRETVGSQIPETGGILGSSDGKHIDHFYFDATANVTGATYEPDIATLNHIIEQWILNLWVLSIPTLAERPCLPIRITSIPKESWKHWRWNISYR